MLTVQLLMQKKYIYCLFSFFIYCGQAIANPIIDEYKNKVSEYNQAVSSQKCEKAYIAAEALLSIDPSDTLSLLRLIYCSKILNKQDAILINEYINGVANSTPHEKELIEFINAINRSKN